MTRARAIGLLLREVMRASDVATRYGGDEFAIILPDTGKTDAWLAAEKLRGALGDLQIDAGRRAHRRRDRLGGRWPATAS